MNGFRPFNEEQIEQFYGLSLAVPTRTLYIGSESYLDRSDEETGVDFRMAEKAIKGLHILNSMSHEPIRILMNNPGGNEYHGYAIYDVIKESKSPTYIKVYGHAMSMGSIILQAGQKRLLSPNATLMLHQGTWEGNGDARDFESYHRENQKQIKLMEEIYMSRMKEKNRHYSVNQLRELLKTDKFLTAKEAIDLGLADE